MWTSTLFDRTGWSEETRTAILALDRAGIPVYADPISWTNWGFRPEARTERRLEQLLLIDLPDAFVQIGPTAESFRRHPWAIRFVGRALSETERLAPSVAATCMGMDELWVPGEFSRQALVRAGVPPEKIHIVPEGVDVEVYGAPVEALPIPGFSGFVFLSVARWAARKGWDVLIRAYVEEFGPDEPVTLALKVDPFDPQLLPRVRAFIRDELGRDPSRTPRILALNLDLPPRDMPRLYRSADAFVLPTRGEGWGRPYMEAMAMGLPTIGTRWSENLTYMNDSNSYLLDYELMDVSEAGWREMPPYRGERWAEPSVDHLSALMRQVFEHRDEARARGARARQEILADFGSDRVAEAVAARLREIRIPRRRARPRAEPGSLVSARIFLRLARASLAAGRAGRAVNFARAALHLVPGSGEAYALIAAALHRLGLYEAAARAERALAP